MATLSLSLSLLVTDPPIYLSTVPWVYVAVKQASTSLVHQRLATACCQISLQCLNDMVAYVFVSPQPQSNYLLTLPVDLVGLCTIYRCSNHT